MSIAAQVQPTNLRELPATAQFAQFTAQFAHYA